MIKDYIAIFMVTALAVTTIYVSWNNLSSELDYISPTVYVPRISKKIAADGKVFTVSAYSKEETCPNRPCVMANGKEPTEKSAACPRRIKLGTRIYIDGVGERVCEDRLSLKFDSRFDLWYGSRKEALKFGLQKLTIYVLQ